MGAGAAGSLVTASGSVYANGTYGSGSFSYAFSKVSGYGNLVGSTANELLVNLSEKAPAGSKPVSYSGVFQCVVTDTVYNVTMTIQLTVYFQFYNTN